MIVTKCLEGLPHAAGWQGPGVAEVTEPWPQGPARCRHGRARDVEKKKKKDKIWCISPGFLWKQPDPSPASFEAAAELVVLGEVQQEGRCLLSPGVFFASALDPAPCLQTGPRCPLLGLFCPPRAKNKQKAEDNQRLNIPALQLAPATASQSRPSAR